VILYFVPEAQLLHYSDRLLGANLWDEATAVTGTLAEVYLNGRGIRLAPWRAALRFHPAADHPKLKQKFPALIAQVVGAAEASFQFTYLSTDGKRKAAIDKEDQRRTLGSNKGGVVFLTDDIQPGATLLVGEGVESVASAMQASGLPGVAVLGVGGLANVEFSPDVVEIVVLAENDDASRKAIDKAAPSLIEKGVKVRVAQPPQGFGDFNDLIDPGKEGGGPGGLVIAKMIIEAAPEWHPKRGKGAKPAAPKQASQASFLVDLAASRCDLFCEPTGEAYASFIAAHGQGEHRETHRLRSKSFNLWLRLLYYAEKNGAPSSEAMGSAVKTLMAKAHFDGDRRNIYLRTAPLDGKSTSTCATRIGGQSRSTPTASALSTNHPCISGARQACCRCRRPRASIPGKGSRDCGKFCASATVVISSSSSHGCSQLSPAGRPTQ
jgi:Toprim domain